MGSRFAALDLSERLRPWHQLGVRFLWGMGGDSLAVHDVERDAAAAPDHVLAESGATSRQVVRQPPPACRSVVPTSLQPAVPEPSLQQSATTTSGPAHQAMSQGLALAGGPNWESPWDVFLQRIHKPAKVVITYWDLANDLGDAPDAQRRDLWKRILSSLAWPKGAVSFWPVCAPQAVTLLAKPALFWRGVAELGATTIAVFGKRANLTLFPDRGYRFRAFTFGGVRVFVLPEPADLVAGDTALKRLTWDTLTSISP